MNKTLHSILALALISGSAQANTAVAVQEKDVAKEVGTLISHDPEVMNVFEAQKQGLDRSASKAQPWSGSYWPDITGNIAEHYRQHNKAGAQVSFIFNYPFNRKRMVQEHKEVRESFKTWSQADLGQNLSPSEKYDLLLGDEDFTFTRSIMEELDFRSTHRVGPMDASKKEYRWIEQGNSFAFWSGICDGWAPASIYLPRPVKPVTLMGASGKLVTFYPEDLKALGTYLFARTNTSYMSSMNYQFAGSRCNNKKVKRDRGTGIIEESACNDMNAGVWHGALLNRIGKDRMGFVLEIDNNFKVNNHAAFGYELTYYNPENGKEGSLRDSIVRRSDMKFDGYSKQRHSKSVYLVGVKSVVSYGNYIWAQDRRDISTDSADKDKVKTVEYAYDLELDAAGNIVGGQWGDRSEDRKILHKVKYAKQPDFIWMGAPKALPYSEMSLWVNPGSIIDPSNPRPFGNMNWSYDSKNLPADWIANAKVDAQWKAPIVYNGMNGDQATKSLLKSAEPFSPLVYYLFDQARNPNEN